MNEEPQPRQTSLSSRDNMVWVPGGEFLMGSDNVYPEEAPVHRVRVDGFWMDCCTVTNREFERLVAETGYVTLHERPANAADYPGAKAGMLAPGGAGWGDRPSFADFCFKIDRQSRALERTSD